MQITKAEEALILILARQVAACQSLAFDDGGPEDLLERPCVSIRYTPTESGTGVLEVQPERDALHLASCLLPQRLHCSRAAAQQVRGAIVAALQQLDDGNDDEDDEHSNEQAATSTGEG